MIRSRRPLSLDRRTEARSLLHDELIAAISRRPIGLVREFVDRWLDTVTWVAGERGPIVFDWFVIGHPSPVLLEIAAEVRSTRRAEARGDFDREEEDWYERHDNDDAEPWEPPTVSERVIASLDGRPGFGPMATGPDVQWLVGRRMGIDRENVFDVIEIDLTVMSLLAEVVDVIRIGDLVVADGRLRGERRDGWSWAA